jgi:hypothetical protein
MVNHPLVQVTNALFASSQGSPTKIPLGLADIGYKDRLVARPPIIVGHGHLTSHQSRQERTQLLPNCQRILWTSANIVDLPSSHIDLLDHSLVKIYQVIHPKEIAHLLSIAVDGYRLPCHSSDQEPGYPTLILYAKLPRPVDA